MSKILYFAYGSNMLSRRLRRRTPSATHVAVGFITKHKLTFDKVSVDGSGKCDAEGTGAENDRVYGVVFEVSAAEKGHLDNAEGLGHGYAEKTVCVHVGTEVRNALVYYATQKDSSRRPYHWYKAFVVAGAKEHSLPADYVAAIEAVQSVDDPDAQRCATERAVLAGS